VRKYTSSGMAPSDDRLRIAIDTSVLVAALMESSGRAGKVVDAWLEGRLEVVCSEATLREAELVLDSQWLRRLVPRDRIDSILTCLRTRSIRVRGAPIKGLPLKDEGDRRLVEAAVDGAATYLVTADVELLGYRGYGGTEFVTATQLLERLLLEDTAAGGEA
jgi:putative PIN family toxin of toxin-antitoxin system